MGDLSFYALSTQFLSRDFDFFISKQDSLANLFSKEFFSSLNFFCIDIIKEIFRNFFTKNFSNVNLFENFLSQNFNGYFNSDIFFLTNFSKLNLFLQKVDLDFFFKNLDFIFYFFLQTFDFNKFLDYCSKLFNAEPLVFFEDSDLVVNNDIRDVLINMGNSPYVDIHKNSD